MRRELIECYYEEYQQELERFLESDPEMLSLEAEIHHYIDILEDVYKRQVFAGSNLRLERAAAGRNR